MNDTFIHLEETESTNLYLRKLCAERMVDEGTVVIADFQTAGRGQRGNGWESDRAKNLTFSLLLRPTHIPIKQQFVLSRLVSLAIVEVLRNYSTDFTIKWPNDIYWREKKIGGILIENDLSGSQISASVIGIGININQEVFCSPAPNPVSLFQITGQKYETPEILSNILERILDRYMQQACGVEDDLSENYFNALFRNNGLHRYESNGRMFNACIKQVEDDGILVLETEEGAESRFAFKEVSFLF